MPLNRLLNIGSRCVHRTGKPTKEDTGLVGTQMRWCSLGRLSLSKPPFALERSGPSLGAEMEKNYSKYQQQIIKNYYRNRDDVAVQRLQELVTELYLAEGKKREKVWDSIELHLSKLDVKPERIQHLRKQNKPELLPSSFRARSRKTGPIFCRRTGRRSR